MTLTQGKPGESRACFFRHVKSQIVKVAFNASHKLEKFRRRSARSEQAPAVELAYRSNGVAGALLGFEVLASESQASAWNILV